MISSSSSSSFSFLRMLTLISLFGIITLLSLTSTLTFAQDTTKERTTTAATTWDWLLTPREIMERDGKRLPHSAIVNKLQEELNDFRSEEFALAESSKLQLGKRAGDRACWRNAFPRHGRVPTKNAPCDSKHEVMEDGICYAKCTDNQQGLGPVCWSRCRCKLTYASLFFCCDEKDVCTELTQNLFTRLPLAIVQFIVDISANPADVQKVVEDFRNLVDTVMGFMLPLCDDEFSQSCSKPTLEDVLASPTLNGELAAPFA